MSSGGIQAGGASQPGGSRGVLPEGVKQSQKKGSIVTGEGAKKVSEVGGAKARGFKAFRSYAVE